MVKKYERYTKQKFKHHIRADVIILGCSLPGIVAAHNLKKTFGASMDIVVLDLANSSKAHLLAPSRQAVSFKDLKDVDLQAEESIESILEAYHKSTDSVARFYLDKYATDLKIPPSIAIASQQMDPTLNKLFQYMNGQAVNCTENYHDFGYLNFIERFELVQYQTTLNYKMQNLFHNSTTDVETDRRTLHKYDLTTMEQDLKGALLLETSREVMRTIVRLVCGAPADQVSVLFYLHQCFRVNGSKNHIDGDNTRFREKLIGKFRHRITHILQKSIQDITMQSKPIDKIRLSSGERVILEPVVGETVYICNWLAMAVRPDQLSEIDLSTDLVAERDAEIMDVMSQGVSRKFLVQYEENFWRRDGYSGDILSVKGPILWATECPKLTHTRDTDKYASLIGYLKVDKKKTSRKKLEADSKEAVLEQLVKLFGEDAASPVSYSETSIEDIYIPRCGDYVALRKLIMHSANNLEWNSLDIFADGDVAGALEAGHTAYLHLLGTLRPQALSFEEATLAAWPVQIVSSWSYLISTINIINTTKFMAYSAAFAVSILLIKAFKSYLKSS